MKKLMMAVLLGSVLLAPTAFAKDHLGGGFKGPNSSIVTVQEALNSKDDTYVVLKGHIEKHIKKDRYSFKDSTGSIVVDIDDDEWNGLTITPDDMVEISGKIDKDWGSIEVDVKNIKKIQ